jgi:hypothetical protein
MFSLRDLLFGDMDLLGSSFLIELNQEQAIVELTNEDGNLIPETLEIIAGSRFAGTGSAIGSVNFKELRERLSDFTATQLMVRIALIDNQVVIGKRTEAGKSSEVAFRELQEAGLCVMKIGRTIGDYREVVTRGYTFGAVHLDDFIAGNSKRVIILQSEPDCLRERELSRFG